VAQRSAIALGPVRPTVAHALEGDPESMYLVGGSDLGLKFSQPLSSSLAVMETNEDKRLMILAEPRQDVALNVVEVQFQPWFS
jgi:hypothetical protein